MKNILFKHMTRLTTLSQEEQQRIADDIQVEEYSKGTLLLRQGEVPSKCYYVLQGCVRQYAVDEAGRETTSNFYTEDQAISVYNHHRLGKASEYTFICLEDSALVVGDIGAERGMFNKHDQLESLTRIMIEEHFGRMQEEFAAFIASSPEERYMTILRDRPALIQRVPQHQLASYLGITPESLSRIKKRVHQKPN